MSEELIKLAEEAKDLSEKLFLGAQTFTRINQTNNEKLARNYLQTVVESKATGLLDIYKKIKEIDGQFIKESDMNHLIAFRNYIHSIKNYE